MRRPHEKCGVRMKFAKKYLLHEECYFTSTFFPLMIKMPL